ncbi:MAG: short-chain dehydrogenase [Oleiphilus sp.]|nr:MAG: short-chain dehydrogenase [Oleiphilus sp.]
MSQTVLITGASRGIGLAFCEVYRARGDTVIAACRTPSEALNSLGVEIIAGIDVSQASAMITLRNALGERHLDLLINNAGILLDEVLGSIDYAQIEAQFQTNALGPLRVTEALRHHLRDGAKVANITSRMGSVADNTSGGRYGYRMSKAALNIASVSLARDLAPRNIAVAILHPGLVGTDMIGGHGNLTPEQAAEALADRIDALTMETSGTFWHSNGEVLPW